LATYTRILIGAAILLVLSPTFSHHSLQVSAAPPNDAFLSATNVSILAEATTVHSIEAVGPTVAELNQQLTTEIYIQASGPGVGAYEIDVMYWEANLTAVGCTASWGICNKAFSGSVVRFAGATTAGISGRSLIGTITFLTTASGTAHVEPKAQVLTDIEGAPLAVNSVISQEILIRTTPTPAPTATPFVITPPPITPAPPVTAPPVTATPFTGPPPTASRTPTPTPTLRATATPSSTKGLASPQVLLRQPGPALAVAGDDSGVNWWAFVIVGAGLSLTLTPIAIWGFLRLRARQRS